jgi:biopolymer transport protein ExbD
MALSPAPGEEDDELVASINTTPLVDVMLVLLIIFLITIPVVTHTVPVALPKDTNQPTHVKPETVTIAVTRDGDIYWNRQPVADTAELVARLAAIARQEPQPEVHIRGDENARYEFIARIVAACQRAGVATVGFIIEPPPRG